MPKHLIKTNSGHVLGISTSHPMSASSKERQAQLQAIADRAFAGTLSPRDRRIKDWEWIEDEDWNNLPARQQYYDL